MLPMLSLDKANHLAYGALVGSLSSASAVTVGVGDIATALTSFFVSAAIGVGKELHDRKHTGTPDWKDAAATVIGGLLVSAPFAVRGLL